MQAKMSSHFFYEYKSINSIFFACFFVLLLLSVFLPFMLNRKFLALKENFQTLTCNWIYGCNTCYRFFCHLYMLCSTEKKEQQKNMYREIGRKTYTFLREMKNYRHFFMLLSAKCMPKLLFFLFLSKIHLRFTHPKKWWMWKCGNIQHRK